jgi:hypothetical protein
MRFKLISHFVVSVCEVIQNEKFSGTGFASIIRHDYSGFLMFAKKGVIKWLK